MSVSFLSGQGITSAESSCSTRGESPPPHGAIHSYFLTTSCFSMTSRWGRPERNIPFPGLLAGRKGDVRKCGAFSSRKRVRHMHILSSCCLNVPCLDDGGNYLRVTMTARLKFGSSWYMLSTPPLSSIFNCDLLTPNSLTRQLYTASARARLRRSLTELLPVPTSA